MSAESIYIDGTWRPATGGGVFAVINPANDEPVAEVSNGTPADATDAAIAAGRAFETWAVTSPGERAQLLRGLHSAILERTEEFAELIVAESGKTLADARGEVAYGAQFVAWFADQASQRLNGEHYLDPAGATRILTQRRPVGPALLITPWNFPLAMITRKLAPALVAGCTAIIKPASQTPLTAIRLVELLHDLGAPAGVVNLVTSTDSRGVTAAVFDSGVLRKISFTGSTEVGSALLRQAADGIVNASMELGGDAPFVVFDDAPDDVIDHAVVAKLRNGGQSCIGANRFLVHDSVADAFVERLAERFSTLVVGDGAAPGTDVGPLIDHAAAARLGELVDRAVADGARIAYRAEVPAGGAFYPPTILVDVPATTPLACSELFGPVAAIVRFGSDEDAVRKANDTAFGLASYVFSRDLDRALRVASRLDFGIVGINRGFVSTAAAPFGGFKTSGLGREGGLHGLDDYLETQYLSLRV